MVRDEIIAALDVGTTKVCCFIAALDDNGQVRVTGIGHHVSDGLKAGSIVDMEAAETSIRAAVHAAEKMAGTTIREVVASIGGGRPSSDVVARNLSIGSAAVGDSDMRPPFQRHPDLASRTSSIAGPCNSHRLCHRWFKWYP